MDAFQAKSFLILPLPIPTLTLEGQELHWDMAERKEKLTGPLFSPAAPTWNGPGLWQQKA